MNLINSTKKTTGPINVNVNAKSIAKRFVTPNTNDVSKIDSVLNSLSNNENQTPNAGNMYDSLFETQKQDFGIKIDKVEPERVTHKEERIISLPLPDIKANSVVNVFNETDDFKLVDKNNVQESKRLISTDDQYLDELKKIRKRTEFSNDFVVI